MEQKQKKRRLFGWFFAVYTFLWIGAAAAGLWLLWGFLEQYDRNSPDMIAKNTAAEIESGSYTLLLQSEELVPDRFFTAEQKEEWLTGYLTGKRISSREVPGEENCYQLSADGEDFAQITLEPDGAKNRYGMQPYRVTKVATSLETVPEIIIHAPEDAIVEVNGVPLTAEDQTGEKITEQAYAGMPEEYVLPAEVTYRLETLAMVPEVSARMEGGSCSVVQQDTVFTVTAEADDTLRKEMETAAVEASHLYARFITQDASRRDLTPYLLGGTEFYDKLAGFYNGWYIDHDSYEFGETTVENFRMYSQDHLSCDVQFVYQVRRGSKIHEFPSAYTLYFIHTKDGWKISSIAVR